MKKNLPSIKIKTHLIEFEIHYGGSVHYGYIEKMSIGWTFTVEIRGNAETDSVCYMNITDAIEGAKKYTLKRTL